MNEIDPVIKDLLEWARPARPVAGADWRDVLRRSRRGRGRLFGVPTRGVLLAAALVVGLGAVAQAETGVFNFIGRDSGHSRKERELLRDDLVSEAAYGSILDGLPRGQVTGISVVPTTTAARLAHVFGGPAGRYPRRAGVVVMKGPFTIPMYLQGCQGTPAICPVPVGRWGWLAYVVLPMVKHGPMAGLVNARWIRVAPAGTALPDVDRLGHVIREQYFPATYRGLVPRQHQGSLKIVARQGTHLTLTPLACGYSDHRYTTQVCEALAKYVAYLGRPHPDETPPATGDFTRISGDLGGWRGNLVITPQSLRQAPPALRRAVARGLASIHGTPIQVVPPGLDCVVNPIPCFRNVPTTTHKVIESINRHGFDLRKIPPDAIPSRFTALLPAGAHPVGAATNSGDPAVARRGFMLTVVFDRTIPFSARLRPEHALGRTWGVFVDENCVTFFHPYYTPPPVSVRKLHTLSQRQVDRLLLRHARESQIDHRKSKYGYLVLRLMDAITRRR